MRTIENSKVGLAVKMDYLIFSEEKYSPCQQRRRASSTKSKDDDQFDGNFTEEVENLSGSPRLYNGLFCISDKTIALEAKNFLSDSGCYLPDSEEDENSVDSCNGTQSEETTDPDSEGQDEGDVDDAKERTLTVPNDDDLSASQNGKNETEESNDDSCDMTYIELDLSSHNCEDIADEVALMMKNLKIGPTQISADSYNFDSSDATPVKECVDDGSAEKNVEDPKRDEISEKQDSHLDDDDDDVKSDGVVDYIRTAGHESLNRKSATRPESFGTFLPLNTSSLCSLPEKTYIQIAECLLDEQTELRLNAEENHLDSDSCGTTLNAPDIPSEMESPNQESKNLFTPDETDPTYKRGSMTYVDLDINEPCPEDITLTMLNNLNIKEDNSPLCRGNPSDQNAIQTHPLCSEIDMIDLDVPSFDLIDDQPFLIDRVTSDMDFPSSLTMPDFYSTQMFPSFGADFNFSSPVCLPSYSNDCLNKTFKTSPEVTTVTDRLPTLISSPISSVLPPGASSTPYVDNSFDVSFFDGSLENGETPYESEFVSQNLHRLQEIDEFLGLSTPETPNTVLPTPPTFSGNTVTSPLFLRQPCVSNLTPTTENPFPTTCRSLNTNVIPRVTTQTPSTQSEAIPAFPNIFFVVSTTSSTHKRPTNIEKSGPAKKPFGCDNLVNSGLSEADSRKKVKQVVASLTDEQLVEFKNNESCLHGAVRTANCEYVLTLLKRITKLDPHIHKEIINSKDDQDQTPLHLAVQANIPAIVHLLIKYGAEVNHLAMTRTNKREAPLHYVASRGIQFKLVLKCLLEANNLDINIKNSDGRTALHCAIEAHRTVGSNFAQSIDSEYIIKKLLESGADPLIQDNNGKNVLMSAIESKDVNLVNLITKTVCKDQIEELLVATTTNGQTCLSLSHSLKEQFNPMQWEKLVNVLTRHMLNN